MEKGSKNLQQDLLYIIYCHLKDHNLEKPAREYTILIINQFTFPSLEKEFGIFNPTYIDKLVIDGKLEKAEKYLAHFLPFTHESSPIFLEIRKQLCLEEIAW